MTAKRLAAAALASALGLMLGSCSPFSNAVSNSWPHFAGGEPNGLPPRQGDPGYAQFIAHGQPNENANAPAGNAPQAAPGQTAAIAPPGAAGDEQAPHASAAPPPEEKPDTRLPPTVGRPGDDSNSVAGGLY
jgi:hypothetical protein